ncbi:hypothetical protein [uncultured Parasphingorhabdus sp.]|uniref:hypothetical protein n=1 Tax=uncultured Parasphingorhabdus sp. TaxID=2709694 RepID=UPI002AA6D45B|nr:hypothetical protein [uncultured Parasphingorhabdus sp.]
MKYAKIILTALVLVLFGWWLLIENSFIADPGHLSGYIQFGSWLSIAVLTIVESKNRRASGNKEPSAAWSGT